MSYILQALKESEAKREANVAQNRETVPPASEEVRPFTVKRRFPLLWLFVGTLVALVIAASVLLKLPAEVTRDSDPGSTGETSPKAVSVEPNAEPEPDNDKSALVGVKLVLDPPVEERTPSVLQSKPAPQPKAVTRSEPVVTTAIQQREAVTELVETPEAPDPYAQTPYLRQLPPELQRALPELRFSVHIYSESRSGRLVKLGDRMMREGQRLTPELSIEAIIPRGVVMRYREQLFKVPTR